MKLGDLAREAGFWAHANRHYKEALKVDPALRPRIETALAGLREEASQAVLAEAREDMRKKRVKDAEKHLTAVLNEFPDERAAVEAAAMLDRIHTQDRTRSVPARDKHLEKLFASAVSDLEYAADSNHKGLTSKSQSRSINSYRNAISRLERGRKKLAGIEKKNKDDRVVVERADELDAQAIELYVTTSLNLVSSYMVQTSYNEALKAANAAVAVAPTDQRLLSARARIENAAADSDWGFGWVRGR
jgi:tetratricopeptide (TPR) repeat protein